jgi:hypothetical protein
MTQNDWDSDEIPPEAEGSWSRHMEIETHRPILIKRLEDIECNSTRPIRNQRTVEPVWPYRKQIEIVVQGGSVFAVKWDKKHGPLTQIGATNIITSTCLSLSAFTDCRVLLITTMNNELATETVEKIQDTARRLGPEYEKIVDICSGKDHALDGRNNPKVRHEKMFNFRDRMVVVVDSSDVNGMRRHLAILDYLEKVNQSGILNIHYFIDEIDDTVRRMPAEAGTKPTSLTESEELRNEICHRVTKVHGCTATPEAVFDYFKAQQNTAPALGFSDEWNQGKVQARPDNSQYVGLGDLQPVPEIGCLSPLGSTQREFNNAKVGKYIKAMTRDIAMNKDSPSYKFFDHFLADERPEAMLLVSITGMVNKSEEPSATIPEILTAIDSRQKMPTMKEVAYILHHRARERGHDIAILTINGEQKDSKYYVSCTSVGGGGQAVHADSAYGALSQCPRGKLVVVYGPTAARGRSFVTETRVPTHLIMMNGKRSAENAVDQCAGRATGCHRQKLLDKPPYILCTEDDLKSLGTSGEHALRKQYRAQEGNALALDLRDKLGLTEEDAPNLYPSQEEDDSILQSVLDFNSRRYVATAGSVCRMAMLVESIRRGHEPSMLTGNMKRIINCTITVFGTQQNFDDRLCLGMLGELGTEIHKKWGIHGSRGRHTKKFVLYAERMNAKPELAVFKNLAGRGAAEETIKTIGRTRVSPLTHAGNPLLHERTPLYWSEYMRSLQQRLGEQHWIRLCNIVADRFLEPDQNEEPIMFDGDAKPPKEYIVINNRRNQKPAL